MAVYRALYDYVPDDDSSSFMPLRSYDNVNKVKDIGNGWFMGFNASSGDFGIFPALYVEKVEKLEVKSDIAGRLLLLPEKPTAPPSEKVSNEIRRLKEVVDNDQMVNVETRSTIKIEPSPASEEGTLIDKIDMTALKAEINRQLMMKRAKDEEPANETVEVEETPSLPTPYISSPKPIISSPKPVISSPKPSIASKPIISSPKPIISSPKPVIDSPKPKRLKPSGLSLAPKPEVEVPLHQENTKQEEVSEPPKHIISNPILLDPISDNYPVPLQPIVKQDKAPTPPKSPVVISHTPPPPIHHNTPPTISAPILQEPIDVTYPVYLQPIVRGDPVTDIPQRPNKPIISAPMPVIDHPEPLSPNKPTILHEPEPKRPNKPIISLPIPIVDEPQPLRPNKPIISAPIPIMDEPQPLRPSKPNISAPIPIMDETQHLRPNKPIISVPIPIMDEPQPLRPSKPKISAPIPIMDETQHLRPNKPIISAPIPIMDEPQPLRPSKPIISVPIPIVNESEPIRPNKPIISVPIPIIDEPQPLRPNKPIISAPIPILDPSLPPPPTDFSPDLSFFPPPSDFSPDPSLPPPPSDFFPDPSLPPPPPDFEKVRPVGYHTNPSVIISVPDEELPDKDTTTLVIDKPEKKKKEKKPKKVKEKKPKKIKEKKPPFDFKGRFYGCIGNCMAKNPLKTIFLGILGGLIAGGINFLLLAFSFRYSYEIAGWITLGITAIFSILLALSSTFRCLVLLMLPSLSTGQGRTAILATIFAVMLTGPVVNISNNAQEVSSSMACTVELIKNQTEALKNQLVEPLLKIARKINDSFTELKEFADSLLAIMDPIISVIEDFQRETQKAFDALKELAQDCKNSLDSAHITCKSGINSAKTSCENFFNSIDPTDDIEQGIIDVGKALGFGKRRKRAAKVKVLRRLQGYKTSDDIMKGLESLLQNEKGTNFDRSQVKALICKAVDLEKGKPVNRSRRGLLANICKILDISIVCDVLDISGPLCSPLDTLADLANDTIQEVKSLLDRITNFFIFGINSTFDLTSDLNSSKTASEIVSNVKADIASKASVVLYYAKIITQVLACSLIFLLLRSFLYLHKWRAKEKFDNIYITKEFEKYDAKRKALGKEHIMPLKSRERKKYIVTNSILMAPAEMKNCKKGAVMIGRSLLIATLVILVDYALYYILVLVETYGKIDIQVSGTNVITLDVQGSSPIAILLRSLASSVAIDYDYNIDFNMTFCLPNPYEPSTANICLVVFLYIVAFVLMFMQAYGLRLRRKIAAHYYPEVEFDRIQYLHAKMIIKRKTLLDWIAHMLTSRKKEKDISERMTFSSWFYYSCPFLASMFDCQPTKTICLNCDRESDGLMRYHLCKTKGCDAIYCAPCFKEMNETCQVCNMKYLFTDLR